MENEVADIRESVAILRVGLQEDLGKSIELASGAGGNLENIRAALQVFWFFFFSKVHFLQLFIPGTHGQEKVWDRGLKEWESLKNPSSPGKTKEVLHHPPL